MKIAFPIIIALELLLLSTHTLVFGQQCPSRNPDDYERDHYVVQAVSIEADDKIINQAIPDVPGFLSQLPLQPGKSFSKADLDTSQRAVIASSGYIDAPSLIYVPLVESVFDDCTVTAGARHVRVVFKVSYVITPLKAGPAVPTTYESFDAQAAPRTKRASALRRLGSIFQLEPFVGFTGSENLAGAGITVNTKKPVFERFRAQGGGSSSTALGSSSVEGDRLFSTALLRELTWRGGYEYSKLPSENEAELKKGTGLVQFFAASKSFGNEEFVIRYGASVEAGNRQSNLEDNMVPAGTVASSGYASMKTYIGGSWRFGPHQFKSSYGLQIGGTNEQAAGADQSVDYLKHIFDSAYKVRFFPWANKPVSLEAQFTGGRIDRRGVLPVAEQFFGGNVDENFIAGSDWKIRSAPFIRSFAGRKLTVGDPLVPLGGDRFVAFNVTAGATVWSKPAIPKEALAEVPTAFEILESHPKAETLRRLLTTEFTTETKSYLDQIAKADYKSLEDDLVALQKSLTSIRTAGVAPATRALIDKGLEQVETAFDILAEIKKKIVFENGKFITTNPDARPELTELLIASLPDDSNAPQPGVLQLVINRLSDLIQQPDPGVDTFLPGLRGHQTSLQAFFDALKTRYDKFETEGLPVARENALKFLRGIHAQIDKIGRELNVFSIGPVFMFDAARLKTANQSSGYRYGIGTGVGIEFFGLQLSGGYSWNPHRHIGEPRGAVVFAFDVAGWLP